MVADFSKYDPKVVKKFLYHVIEANRDDEPRSEPDKPTRDVGEIYKQSVKSVAPQLQERVRRLEAKMQHIDERLTRLTTLLEKKESSPKHSKKDLDAMRQRIERIKRQLK